jgi:pimeloyl-ACP methyl ester carboxylesterase
MLMGIPVNGGAFAEKKFLEIKGRTMAYLDEGDGPPIVFQHGNPTSSYLWRKVMPACTGLGRLIACDLIGMGDSEKLPDSGPDRYTYAEQREFLFALWEELGLTGDVVLVIHDWGATLGFDWARQHPDRVQGIAYLEAAPIPLIGEDFPDDARELIEAFRSPAGEDMVLRDNAFVEAFLIEAEKANSYGRRGPPPDAELAPSDPAGRVTTGGGRDCLGVLPVAERELGTETLDPRRSGFHHQWPASGLLRRTDQSDRGAGERWALPAGIQRRGDRTRRGRLRPQAPSLRRRVRTVSGALAPAAPGHHAEKTVAARERC